ncbi:hypothetical protein FPV67DRAFT_1451988 [Lyophyllum atratum]|nr:hypothetical protein FPV67DRAFT_1451988 [Lyophyllum atratum]
MADSALARALATYIFGFFPYGPLAEWIGGIRKKDDPVSKYPFGLGGEKLLGSFVPTPLLELCTYQGVIGFFTLCLYLLKKGTSFQQEFCNLRIRGMEARLGGHAGLQAGHG